MDLQFQMDNIDMDYVSLPFSGPFSPFDTRTVKDAALPPCSLYPPLDPPSMEDWERFKTTILEQYIGMRMTVKELVQHMDTWYQFKATPRMFKLRFTQWGVIKYAAAARRHLNRQHLGFACSSSGDSGYDSISYCSDPFSTDVRPSYPDFDFDHLKRLGKEYLLLTEPDEQNQSSAIGYNHGQLNESLTPEPTPVLSAPHDPGLPLKARDDCAVQAELTQQVDYMSHEWREEDIWTSWRYVVKRRKDIINCERLENASWRQWMKIKRGLKTVTPESLNWLKDCDVTWLYGPLQVGPQSLTTITPPLSHMSCSSLFIENKKSNLKKRPASAIILEHSQSQQSLLQRAGEIIRIQQASSPAGGRPSFRRSSSAFNLPSATDSLVAATPSDQDNWLKDYDDTSLYGPLQVGTRALATVTPPPTRSILTKTRRHSVSWSGNSRCVPLIEDSHLGLARSHISYEGLCNNRNEESLQTTWKTLLRCTNDDDRRRLMNVCWRQWARVATTLARPDDRCGKIALGNTCRAEKQRDADQLPLCITHEQVYSANSGTIPTLGIPPGSCATLVENGPKVDVSRHTSPSDHSVPTTRSDVSSPGWIDDEKDWPTLQVVYTSTAALLGVYGKYSAHGRSGRDSKAGQATGCSGPSSQGKGTSQQDQGSRKRKFGRMDQSNGEEEGDGPDDWRRHTTSNKPCHPEKSSEPNLACPFNKYDSRLFGPGSPDESYHGCASCSFVNVGYLKQHLQRVHYMPKHYCFRCYTKFSSQSAVAAHMRSDPPCSREDPPLYRERISIDLAEELGLERKNPPGTDKKDYWHRVYGAFFPGAANLRSVSPFYEGPAAQQLNEFLSFSRSTIPDLLVRVQQRLGHDLNSIMPPDQGQLADEILQVAGQRYMENIAVYRFPQLGQRYVDTRTQGVLPQGTAPVAIMPANERFSDSIRDFSSTSATCQDSEPVTDTTLVMSLASDTRDCQYGGKAQEDTNRRLPVQLAGSQPDLSVGYCLVEEDRLYSNIAYNEPRWASSVLGSAIGNEGKVDPVAVQQPVAIGIIDINWDAELDNMEGFDWDVFQAPDADWLQPGYLH